MQRLPLEGIRVIDMSWVAAGPGCARQLAIMGAEVIKVESQRRLDLTRTVPPWIGGVPGVDRSGSFSVLNVSKKSCTIQIADPRGAELARRLIAKSDIVIENFGQGTTERLGLDYPSLSKIRPDIIMVSISGFGRTGPDKNNKGYGRILHAVSGLSALIGFPGGPPRGTRNQWADSLASLTSTYAILLALFHRMKTGVGQYIDVSMLEATSVELTENVMDFVMNQRNRERMGNRDNYHAPRGCFRCRGEDKWIAIAVKPEEWDDFARAIGSPAWTIEERFASPLQRLESQDELERLVETWTVQHTPLEAMEILQRGGIAAGPSLDVEELSQDPSITERGIIVEIEHPLLGKCKIPGLPFRFSGIKRPKYRRAPLLGEDNDYVFRQLLKMSEGEVEALKAQRVIY